MKARQWFGSVGRLAGGVDVYPYQLSAGATVRFAGEFSPAMRIYVGPVKLWATLRRRGS